MMYSPFNFNQLFILLPICSLSLPINTIAQSEYSSQYSFNILQIFIAFIYMYACDSSFKLDYSVRIYPSLNAANEWLQQEQDSTFAEYLLRYNHKTDAVQTWSQ